MKNISKEDSIRGAFFSSIVADALCLGSHYEYDAKKYLKHMEKSLLKNL